MTHALFYQNPVALDKNTHGQMSVASNIPLHFTKNLNAVPITLVELPHIVQFYPVAFSTSHPATPLAILGLRNQENLFINEQGEWLENTYIPAYIRRYPFIFSADPKSPDRLTLCIDDTNDVLLSDQSNPLFIDNGELSSVTRNALDFCSSYQAAAEKTQIFTTALDDSGILIDRHAEIRMPDNQLITLSGFRQIDEEKLDALPKDLIAKWHEEKWLGKIYAAVSADRNWQNLFQLMEKKLAE